MTSFTQGIRAVDALKWRAWNGMVADLWVAEGAEGGGGHYVSPDPRLVIFLDDGAEAVQISDGPRFADRTAPPRLCFVPAGMPLWSRIRQTRRFRHLDIHFEASRLAALLDGVAAPAARLCPVLLATHPQAMILAGLLAADVETPACPDLYGEGLVQALLAALFTPAAPDPDGARGGLTPLQLRRVTEYLADHLDQRVSVATLADLAGLSESWFAHAFKQTTGVPPHRWQLKLRIERARHFLLSSDAPLADVAVQTGFADQAHLTRSFRSLTGTTPALWRRENRGLRALPRP